jgi:hypothetical protein
MDDDITDPQPTRTGMRLLRATTTILMVAWFLPSVALPHGAPLWTINGERAGDALGTAVAGLGDVDGDGHPDVAIGEPGFDGAAGVDCGRVRVFSPLTGQLLWTFEGEAAGDLFGSAIAQIGDVDVDGHNDIAIGAPDHSGPAGAFAGRVYLFSGANGSLMRVWDGEAGGPLGTGFGFALSQSDMTNDGNAELIVGAPRFDGFAGTWCGKVYVFNPSSGALIHQIEGPQAYSYFGFSVSGIGDLNFDFRQDFLVGAPYYSGIAPPYNGKAFAFSGANASLIHSWEGESATSLFGFEVADAGDTNSDGARDAAVAADEENIPGQTNVGKVFIFSGISGTLIRSLLGDGGEDELFGCSLTYIGDVDHDNYGDLLVGARGNWGPNGWGYGSAFVFSGKTGEILIDWSGENAKDGFGVSVSGAGDTDGDGTGDVVIGAFGFDSGNKFECGRAYVYSTDLMGLTMRPFGVSTIGSGNYAPSLSGDGWSQLEQGRPEARIRQALGGAHALLWIGVGRGDTFPFFGGHLYIDLSQFWALAPLSLQGTPGVPGAGEITLPVGSLRDFPGLVLNLQALVIDPGSPYGLALTNGLELSVKD